MLFKHAIIIPNVIKGNTSDTAFNAYKMEAIINGVQQMKNAKTTINNILVILTSLKKFLLTLIILFKNSSFFGISSSLLTHEYFH